MKVRLVPAGEALIETSRRLCAITHRFVEDSIEMTYASAGIPLHVLQRVQFEQCRVIFYHHPSYNQLVCYRGAPKSGYAIARVQLNEDGEYEISGNLKPVLVRVSGSLWTTA